MHILFSGVQKTISHLLPIPTLPLSEFDSYFRKAGPGIHNTISATQLMALGRQQSLVVVRRPFEVAKVAAPPHAGHLGIGGAASRSRRLEVAAVLVAAVVVVGEAEILFFAVARLLRRGPLQQQVAGCGQRWQIVWKMVRLTFWIEIRHVYSRYSSIWVWYLSIYSILKPKPKYSKSLIPILKTQTQILKKYLSILCFSKCFVFFAN